MEIGSGGVCLDEEAEVEAAQFPLLGFWCIQKSGGLRRYIPERMCGLAGKEDWRATRGDGRSAVRSEH